MDVSTIISRLNWFYSLEVTQVDNYMAQSKIIKDKYISLALERFSYIEQQHIDNIASHIRKLGAEPTKSGDAAAPYLGKLLGSITPATGIINMLKINIVVEQKAKADYKKFIDKVSDKELLKTLWANFIDEDLHTAWMIEKTRQLAAENEKKRLNL